KIERKEEEKKKFEPQTSRSFYIFFQVTHYTSRMGDAVSYFIQNVLIPGDNLTVVTPMKTYRMKSETLKILPKGEVIKQLKGKLRRDALMGSSEYRSALNDITALAKEIAGIISQYNSSPPEYRGMDLDEKLSIYKLLLEKLEHIRYVDEHILLEFAKFLKDKEGQKYVFLFYQREFIPLIEPRLLNQLISLNQERQDILFTLSDLFEFYRRDISIDVNQVKQVYADSSISVHFLFFTKPAEHIPGLVFEEHSEDIFAPLMEMAKATGGSTESSANPSFLFKRAVEASENYYLLYYAPLNYQKDGKFKNIKVKVKGKSYKVTHRAGYFAN
ncbi:MAG: hypothetical protein HQ555_01935, partial [Candidatus Aminicenantes bacterium]|nr:hypothetical protein [Candidatus Aminicenantes bacterium]